MPRRQSFAQALEAEAMKQQFLSEVEIVEPELSPLAEAVGTIAQTMACEATWDGMGFSFLKVRRYDRKTDTSIERYEVPGIMVPFLNARDAALAAANRHHIFEV